MASFSLFYYGWVIVALGFFAMAFWLGISAAFSVFYVALLDEFGWMRAESAGVMSTAQLVYSLAAPFVGNLIHRYGPRKIVVPGILTLGCGLALCSSITSLAQFYVYYGLLAGLGVTSIAMVAFTVIIAPWFEAQRGLAMGIASAGSGVGMLVLVPLSQHLILNIGWRGAYLVLALLVIVILLPTNAFLLKHRPQDMGLLPDGKSNGPGGRGPNPDHHPSQGLSWTWPRLLHSANFYGMIIFPALSVFSFNLVVVHNIRFLVDQGIPEMTGASAFAVVGIVCVMFRIVWGWLSDRIGRELTYTAAMFAMSAGIACLLLLEHTGRPVFIYGFAMFFGMGWGGNSPIFAAAAADLFKGPTFGLLYGLVECMIGIAGALGAWSGGFIFDATQSYGPAFILTIFTSLSSAAFIWVAAPRNASRLLSAANQLD